MTGLNCLGIERKKYVLIRFDSGVYVRNEGEVERECLNIIFLNQMIDI